MKVFFFNRKVLKKTTLVLIALIIFCIIAINYSKRSNVSFTSLSMQDVNVQGTNIGHRENQSARIIGNVGSKQNCVLPKLEVNDPVMMSFFKRYNPVTCPAEPANWVYVNNGTLRFSKDVLHNIGTFKCDCFPLLRDQNDAHIRWGTPIKDVQDGSPVPANFFKISCLTPSSKLKYEDILYGVATNKQIEDRQRSTRPPANGLDGLSILMLGYDSMSRMAWIRRMPQTRKFFLDTMNGIELEGYNIMGDGTPAALFPMLTGKHEEEMYESRKMHKGAKPVDGYPWIWKNFKEKGYVTSWADAMTGIAPFNFRLLGFRDAPTDYYMRPYYLGVDQVDRSKKKNPNEVCRGPISMHQLWLNWPKQIMEKYTNKPKFMFHFYAALSHDDNNRITMGDEELKNFLSSLHSSGHLNHTVVVLFGDHGARYAKGRATWSGKLEERLPYMGFSFPPWFHKRHESLIKNLRTNVHRLTTALDVHETLLDFLRFDGAGTGDLRQRGISLFKEIPIERDCSHANIRNHWCACLSWTTVPNESPEVITAAKASVKFINDLTSAYRDDCANLTLLKVTSAEKKTSNTDMLKFEKSADMHGRKPVFSNKLTEHEVIYQLGLVTTPGDGHFELTLSLKSSIYKILEKDISRINKYGDDPKCIYAKNRQLRQFCYCRSKV